MKVKVYAKLNLTLNVTGRRNGFHDIDSLAVSVDIYDEIQASPRSDRAVTVRGMPSVNDADNSACKAACAFVRAFGSCGADITVNKGIPFAAGMGGSSGSAGPAGSAGSGSWLETGSVSGSINFGMPQNAAAIMTASRSAAGQ